ncbi:unnamed protein product [Hermetia illucens]|uniref:Small ribosomal subunit protein mS23 n=1 Tax=Hermetia illucens TaxID=343691 RepID=A0A7R8V0W4_HERIL|nr:probable 28S ribosomal protein S23, mitochondrial [Hermetia illucens]CAD7090638.1 unnamed protein product [Hermetia illucens]
MAQSRLEKIGTIFTRVTGLLRSGAMKPEDKPIWYDVYAAFPPKLEPRYDRPAPSIPLRQIFYEEDIVRAKFHKQTKHIDTVSLADTSRKSNAQQFIGIYNNLKGQGALDDEKIFETAQEMLKEEIQKRASSGQPGEEEYRESPGLVSSFSEAKNTATVNIKDIFKE